MKQPSTPRDNAFQVLNTFEHDRQKQQKSNGLIHGVLSGPGASWSSSDRALFTALIYGVLRHWFSLEAVLQELSRFPLSKIEPKAKVLLKLGLFQLRYLDQVPDYAAVNTTLELAKGQKCSPKTVSFINGMLRTYQRKTAEGPFPPIPSVDVDPIRHFTLAAGFPPWFTQRLLKVYPLEQLLAMAAILQTPPPLSLRVNILKCSVTAYHQALQEAEIPFQIPEPEQVPEGLLLEGFHGSPTTLPGYAAGHFSVQDISSALVAHWVNPQPGETVVDLCAAPGSKTTHMAALMKNQGTIHAVELSPKRIEALTENLQRLGVTNVHITNQDAMAFRLPETVLAHRVLVDAPCSGLGTLRKHPEILIHQTEKHLAHYPTLQLALLEKGWSLLRPGGSLVYSTCSIDPAENTQVVSQFLSQHASSLLEGEEQRLITPTSDGFYLAKLHKAEA